MIDMTDKDINDVADKIARMIVTEGEILTEKLWALQVSEVLREHIVPTDSPAKPLDNSATAS
jgi:hypothetical protein